MTRQPSRQDKQHRAVLPPMKLSPAARRGLVWLRIFLLVLAAMAVFTFVRAIGCR